MSLEELQQLKASFDLRWNADMRARKLWQEAHPGNDLVWPDHADLCVWLMEQEDERKKEVSSLLRIIYRQLNYPLGSSKKNASYPLATIKDILQLIKERLTS